MPIRAAARYHVPRNQCFEGSKGGTKGNVHLHVLEPMHVGRLHREVGDGKSLCGRSPWYHREPEPDQRGTDHRCSRCLSIAERYNVEWPHYTGGDEG